MGYSSYDSKDALKALNSFLADKSYIVGHTPTVADAVVFEAIKEVPTEVHVLRWYNHIKSMDLSTLPGERKPLNAYGPEESANDDDIDLFGSDDEEDPEVEAEKARRLAEYQAKKAKKPAVIAKSSVVLEIKPWGEETDMQELETLVRGISMDGLLWGDSKLVDIAFGLKKLEINCVVEDLKVGTDDLEERICEFEDHVQSMDIASFNKI